MLCKLTDALQPQILFVVLCNFVTVKCNGIWACCPRGWKAVLLVASLIGQSSLFWSHRWLQGMCMQESGASSVCLFNTVGSSTVKTRTVAQGLLNDNWVCDIRGSEHSLSHWPRLLSRNCILRSGWGGDLLLKIILEAGQLLVSPLRL